MFCHVPHICKLKYKNACLFCISVLYIYIMSFIYRTCRKSICWSSLAKALSWPADRDAHIFWVADYLGMWISCFHRFLDYKAWKETFHVLMQQNRCSPAKVEHHPNCKQNGIFILFPVQPAKVRVAAAHATTCIQGCCTNGAPVVYSALETYIVIYLYNQ